ncbi:MAG TPA: GDP-mannose 4,6-dehydratase [Bacteroidota bacterium]|nr:GDP-mannose 4,6-dehydratase [Bacteroidota bacterium]
MNALIFGANGQDGYYLQMSCKQKEIIPICISRHGNGVQGDVSEYSQVEELVKQYRPSYIFHLAANSTTRHDVLFENHETISTGTLNILEAVKKHCPSAKVFITGSGVQFKNNGKPISENDPFEASSPYSIARIQSVYAARYYRSLGIQTYVGYLFHHESPLRKPSHVSQKIALAVQRIDRGNNEIIELGDISVTKEWTFAADVAEGIFTLLSQDKVCEAVIGSGKGYAIEYWLQLCFNVIGKPWQEFVRLQQGYKVEYPVLISDPKTIYRLGWQPQTSIEELAKMMVRFEHSAHSTR